MCAARSLTYDSCLDDVVHYLEERARRLDENPLYPVKEDIRFKVDKLMEADNQLCQIARLAVEIPSKMPNSKIQKGDLTMSGSCAEGCMLARWFYGKPKVTPIDTGVNVAPKATTSHADNRPVDAGDQIAKFISGIGKVKAERHPGRLGNLQSKAGMFLQMITAGSSSSDTSSRQATGIPEQLAPDTIPGSPRKLEEWDQLRGDPWEIEADILADLGRIPESCRALLQHVEGRPGNVMLPFCGQLRACVRPAIWKKIESQKREGRYLDVNTAGFFDSVKIKKIISIISIFKDNDNMMPLVLAWIFQVPAKNVKIAVQSECTKTSHQFTINAKLTTHFSMNLASDFVGCFKVDFWPQVAAEWITRNRKWPSITIIGQIISAGSQLVPRSEEEHLREFRWSFSHAEKTLAREMNDCQRRCYFILKMMFYRYIKTIHTDLSSYMMKTTMFWVCEQYPPEDGLWKANRMIASVKFLLGKVEHFFRRCTLPMYFIPQMNLLARVPPEACRAVADKISYIRLHLIQMIPVDIPQVVSCAMTQAVGVSRLVELAEATTDHTLSLFAKMLLHNVSGDTLVEPYSFDQCYQEEEATFLLLKKARKRKHQSQHPAKFQ